MRPSLIYGKLLPESPADFTLLLEAGIAHSIKCLRCNQPFSPDNTKTAAGWRDTQISGVCEQCFDTICKDMEEGGLV